MREAETIWAARAPTLAFILEICEKREVTSIAKDGARGAAYQRRHEGEMARRQRRQSISRRFKSDRNTSDDVPADTVSKQRELEAFD